MEAIMFKVVFQWVEVKLTFVVVVNILQVVVVVILQVAGLSMLLQVVVPNMLLVEVIILQGEEANILVEVDSILVEEAE